MSHCAAATDVISLSPTRGIIKMTTNKVKRDLYFRLAPLTASAPSQTDKAFILVAFAVVLFFETTGVSKSNCPLKPSGITGEKSFASMASTSLVMNELMN